MGRDAWGESYFHHEIFSVVTDTNQLRSSDFAAQATRSSGPNVGTPINNIGTISVPIPEISTFLPVIGVCALVILTGVPSLLRRRNQI